MIDDKIYIAGKSYYFIVEYPFPGSDKPRILFRIKDEIFEDIEYLKNISKNCIHDIFNHVKKELKNDKDVSIERLQFLIKKWESWKNEALDNFKKSEIKFKTYYKHKRYGISEDGYSETQYFSDLSKGTK